MSTIKIVSIAAVIVVAIPTALFILTVGRTDRPRSVPDRLAAFVLGAQYLDDKNVVFQTRGNNCGAAVLKMIFDYHRKPLPLEAIDSALPRTKEGSSMFELKRFAVSHSLKAEGWKLTEQDLKMQRFPVIAYLLYHHYIVIDSMSGSELFYRDPSLGRAKMATRSFNKIWNGEALVFY